MIDFIGSWILIHVDGGNNFDDQWVDKTSPYIRSVGRSRTARFSYLRAVMQQLVKRFLEDTGTSSAPKQAFEQQYAVDFSTEMKVAGIKELLIKITCTADPHT